MTPSWRRRPGRRRDLARPSERQESVKEAQSPSAKTAFLSESLAGLWGGCGGGGGGVDEGRWRLEALRPFTLVSTHSTQDWAPT